MLHDKIDRVLQTVGVDPDRRKFAPHVTLARLKNSPEHRVAEFLTHHSLFVAPAFDVEEFVLYSTIRSPAGSKYRVEKRYPVAP
jgi:2'-5' RNA ligase